MCIFRCEKLLNDINTEELKLEFSNKLDLHLNQRYFIWVFGFKEFLTIINFCFIEYSDKISEWLYEVDHLYKSFKEELHLFEHRKPKTRYSDAQKRYYLSLLNGN